LNVKFDMGQLSHVVERITEANVFLRVGGHIRMRTISFTTSPALGAVAGQYASYLGGHPGSLIVATNAATTNVQWLHDSLSPLIRALTEQEYLSVDSFTGMLNFTDAPEKAVQFGMPPRPEIPVLDLAYVPPVAAVEAATPLKALTAMFAGDDSGIIAASESWASASKRMLQASESLQSAAAILAGTTEGSAFHMAERAITTVSTQCATVAANSTAMANSMLQLPPIRAAAHAQLIAIEAEIAAEAAAAGAATGGTGAAAVAAKSQAQVAAFVAGYLQPALDTARPLVTNLSVPVPNHTGGGSLHAGGADTMAAREAITQVAGGASAPGVTPAAAQPNATAPQTGQVGTTPASAAQAAPINQTMPGPTGGVHGAPGGTQAASPASATLGRSGTPSATGGPGVNAGRPGPATAGPRGGTTGVPGRVPQPLLPRAMAGISPGSPSAGTIAGTGPHAGSGASGAQNSAGARGAAPGNGGGMAPAGPGQANQGHRAGGVAGAGAAPLGGAGQKGAGNGQGKQASAKSLFGGGQGRSRGRRTGGSLLDSYFRRQFLGEKATTVRKVIR
jgi:hypothetical protein